MRSGGDTSNPPGAASRYLIEYMHHFRQPKLATMLFQFFMFTFGFAMFIAGMPLFVERRLTWQGAHSDPRR
jgi:hypothetical protein